MSAMMHPIALMAMEADAERHRLQARLDHVETTLLPRVGREAIASMQKMTADRERFIALATEATELRQQLDLPVVRANVGRA